MFSNFALYSSIISHAVFDRSITIEVRRQHRADAHLLRGTEVDTLGLQPWELPWEPWVGRRACRGAEPRIRDLRRGLRHDLHSVFVGGFRRRFRLHSRPTTFAFDRRIACQR